MFGIGTPELIIILVVVLIIFGPGKLPQLGSALGGALRSLRKGTEEEPKRFAPREEEKKGA